VDEIVRVGVVGSGTMGCGIAEVCARADLDVQVVLSGPESMNKGRQRFYKSIDQRVRRGQLSELDRDTIGSRVSFGADFDELADRQMVIETVTELESTKLLVMKQIDAAVHTPDVLLASTTSSIPIMRIARSVERASQVIGVHFFNPAPKIPLVELIGCLLTGQETRVRTESFVTGVLGMRVIWSKDRAGFVVNALLLPYLLSAIRMLESGFAEAEEIDVGMELGCAHPMGPLRLTDLVGLDTVAAVARAMYEEFKEPLYAPPPLLLRMVEAQHLGRKTGHGFYRYDSR
jgi:3-hydroxybutyryl-CoA dehydrogenase